MQALKFIGCDNLKLGPLTHIDSPKNHISITECYGALISYLHIIAPENSPNTDGIDISRSTNIIIEHSTISTGSILNYSLTLYFHVNNKTGLFFLPINVIYIFIFLIFIGDDCIAINSGSKFINITAINCGPGHGIRFVLLR